MSQPLTLRTETGDEHLDLLEFEDVKLVSKSQLASDDAEARVHEIMKRPAYTIRIHLHYGRAQARYLTCDLSHEYVSINADYRS